MRIKASVDTNKEIINVSWCIKVLYIFNRVRPSPDLPMYTPPPTVNSFPAHSMEIRRSYSAYYRVQKEMDDECRSSQFLYNRGNYNNFEPKVTI